MGFTETTYFNRLRHHMTLEGINTSISRGSHAKISLEEFKKLDLDLPKATETAINCLVGVAKGTYHLFYAIVIGLPSDWLTFKTHIFLLNWETAKSNAEDVYFHVLALTDPVLSAFHIQEKLYLEECKSVDPTNLKETIQLPAPKEKRMPPPPPSNPKGKPPTPPPFTPKITTSSPKPKTPLKEDDTNLPVEPTSVTERKKALFSKGFSPMAPKPSGPSVVTHTPPPKKPTAVVTHTPPPKTPSTSENDPDTLSGSDLRKRMHGILSSQGLGPMGRGTKPPPKAPVKKDPDPVSGSTKADASFSAKREEIKTGTLDTKKVAAFEELFKKTRSK
ncbi:MAG: hypothetical protein KDK59_06675 [Simkania sp.]|nr:hypothetical protein [Simkania sp.]